MKRAEFVFVGLLTMGALVVGIGIGGMIASSQNREDPDRARFMLECHYDWMLSNEQCKSMLEGEDPPQTPPEYQGC